MKNQLLFKAAKYEARINDLTVYLKSCVEAGDWHGVRDAAADIEVQQALLNSVQVQVYESC